MVKYGMLGLSLTLFGLLLLSFREPLGYDAGYAVSTVLLLLQAGLFTFLYVLLSLETYSLLVGSARCSS